MYKRRSPVTRVRYYFKVVVMVGWSYYTMVEIYVVVPQHTNE